jgi:hypothetical protein
MQEVLEGTGSERSLRAFVVWEPVIRTDVAPPTTGTLGRLHDPGARQFWDPNRIVSKDIVRAILAHPDRYRVEDVDKDTIVWDTVALFPKGVLWEDDLPMPTFYGAPVVDSIEGLSKGLEAIGTTEPRGN